MKTLMLRADGLLRGDAPGLELPTRRRHLLLILAIFGGAYGASMGTFSGLAHGHWLQMIYSALKVPLLLAATFLLSLPSFFVLNTILGVRSDFAEVLRALIAGQAALTVVLSAFAPITLLWYASSSDYDQAILFNALMFGGASFAGQQVLRRLYRPLVARHPRHRQLIIVWLIIYAFVGIQMGWVLRPFVGNPDTQPQFFRAEMWGNAYVVVARRAAAALR